MYYLLYPILYLLSLLPWWLWYAVSDGVYLLVYYVFKYRRKTVSSNLQIAFPEKSAMEREKIARDFYHSFIDMFVEMIKLFSISRKTLTKRVYGNVDLLTTLPPHIKKITIISAHFFNWEMASVAYSALGAYPLVGVYMPLKNKAIDKIMYDMRTRFGAALVPATQFTRNYIKYAKTKHALGLIADQKPGDPTLAYWIPFFNKLTPFVKGPEKSAQTINSAVVFLHFHKVKRGYYQLNYNIVTTDALSYAEGTLTKAVIALTEEAIKRHPSNYLWTHKRWKYTFSEAEYGHLVVK